MYGWPVARLQAGAVKSARTLGVVITTPARSSLTPRRHRRRPIRWPTTSQARHRPHTPILADVRATILRPRGRLDNRNRRAPRPRTQLRKRTV